MTNYETSLGYTDENGLCRMPIARVSDGVIVAEAVAPSMDAAITRAKRIIDALDRAFGGQPF